MARLRLIRSNDSVLDVIKEGRYYLITFEGGDVRMTANEMEMLVNKYIDAKEPTK